MATIARKTSIGTAAEAISPHDRLSDVAELLRALALRITPANAPLLFDITLKVSTLPGKHGVPGRCTDTG